MYKLNCNENTFKSENEKSKYLIFNFINNSCLNYYNDYEFINNISNEKMNNKKINLDKIFYLFLNSKIIFDFSKIENEKFISIDFYNENLNFLSINLRFKTFKNFNYNYNMINNFLIENISKMNNIKIFDLKNYNQIKEFF